VCQWRGLLFSANLALIGQPPLRQSLALSIQEEIRSRVTDSVVLPRLAPEAIEQFILGQLDRAGLGHHTFTPEALARLSQLEGVSVHKWLVMRPRVEKVCTKLSLRAIVLEP
jgi:type II secretory pathway predicted ATPase ExeA